MSVPTIALYVSPPSSICSTPHHSSQIPHGPSDFDLNPRPPCSSVASSSSAQKSIIGGLSCLFSSPATRHASSSSSSFIGTEELGSLWHDRSEDLNSFFCYSSYPASSLKCRDPSLVSVFQGPVLCSGSGSTRSPSLLRTTREWSSGDWRVGKDRIFSGFIRNALGSCLDFNSSRRKKRRRKRLRSMATTASWEGGTDGLMKTETRPMAMEKCEGREDPLVVSDDKDEEGERETAVAMKFAEDLAIALRRKKAVGFVMMAVKEEKVTADDEGRGRKGRRDRGSPMEEIGEEGGEPGLMVRRGRSEGADALKRRKHSNAFKKRRKIFSPLSLFRRLRKDAIFRRLLASKNGFFSIAYSNICCSDVSVYYVNSNIKT